MEDKEYSSSDSVHISTTAYIPSTLRSVYRAVRVHREFQRELGFCGTPPAEAERQKVISRF
jgi:hypothetical protein